MLLQVTTGARPTPLVATRKGAHGLGHCDPRPAIGVAPEQKATTTTRAEGVLGGVLEQLMSTEVHTATQMKPNLMDVQATISSARQPDQPFVWITGEACDGLADLAAEPSIARVEIQKRKGIQPGNMVATSALANTWAGRERTGRAVRKLDARTLGERAMPRTFRMSVYRSIAESVSNLAHTTPPTGATSILSSRTTSVAIRMVDNSASSPAHSKEP